MRCRQCGFENMPGLERCGRCSSILVVREPVAVTPPRARGARWLRRMGYRARAVLHRAGLGDRALPPELEDSAARPPQPSLWPGAVSVVPGLGHFHTAGNPGRNDLDDDHELNYAAICRAIAEAGFGLYVAHEFTPKGDRIEGLRRAFAVCDQG